MTLGELSMVSTVSCTGLSQVPAKSQKGFIMANNGGGSIGLLGVLLGGILVLVVGGAVLYATGVIGNKNSVTIQLPKIN
jgi:hypothetical protein